ncbi:MAG: class I SAM-dependent methyltransferase [Longimicrobiales bacterium]
MDTKPWSGFKAKLYSVLYRAPKSNNLVVNLAGLSESDRALDIGCGPGAAVRAAAETARESTGVDRAEAMVEIARRRSRNLENTRFEVGSAESLPFPDDSFTVVWTAHSFHHWEDRDAGLAEMLRVLSPGGRALILETAGKKHGLTDSGAKAVIVDLESLGFQQVASKIVDKQVVISGVTPNLPT